MTLISPAYCTQADVDRYLSEQGATGWADHDQNGTAEDGVYDDVINQGTEEFNLYCAQRYEPAQLATSTLVNRWTTVFACYFLSQRRANPAPDSLAREFDRIKLLLEKIEAGTLNIPGLPLRGDTRPTFDNLRIDRRFVQRKIRVQREASSDVPSTLRQDFDESPSVINW